MADLNTNTKHQPRPCLAAHERDERVLSLSPADKNREAVQAAFMECFGAG